MSLINEENIIEALKSSPNVNANPDFVIKIEIDLIKRANQMTERKSSVRTFSFVCSTVIALFLIVWISFYNGQQIISKTVNGGLSLFHTQDVTSLKNKPLIYILHSHNQESFLPEMPDEKDIEKAISKDVNITLVGKYLSSKLNEFGIDTLQDHTDYTTTPNFSYPYSYKYSRQVLLNTLKTNHEIDMVFDVHRDSLKREKTTVMMNNKEIARIQFVVATKSNPNYNKNLEFANKINNKLVNLYPGFSKGVQTTEAPADSLSYNQDLHPNSVLMEIGGPENSLEEEYRAVDLLAKVIADLSKEMK